MNNLHDDTDVQVDECNLPLLDTAYAGMEETSIDDTLVTETPSSPSGTDGLSAGDLHGANKIELFLSSCRRELLVKYSQFDGQPAT